jgi:hypothetical protein
MKRYSHVSLYRDVSCAPPHHQLHNERRPPFATVTLLVGAAGRASGAMAGAGAVRLYVGGLPQEISGDDVAARFTPFGSVLQLELAPEKGGSTTCGAKRCRSELPKPFLNATHGVGADQ